MSHTNSESGVNHQIDDDANYYDEDDLIVFQFESNQIEIHYSLLSRYSKLVRNKYLPSNIKNGFSQELLNFKNQQNVNTESIILYFKLLQNGFNFNQNLTYNEYRDLFKITDFLQVKKFLINHNQYFENQNNIIDFQIQIILFETKNNTDLKNSQFQLNIAIEDLLSKKITECLQKENFAKVPITIVERIIKKSDKKQISSDLLYDFIKKNVNSNYILFPYLDIERLSEYKLDDMLEFFSNPNESYKHYMSFIPCCLPYMMKLKNDKKKVQKQFDDLIIEKSQLQENLNQMKKSFNDCEKDKNQLKQESCLLHKKIDDIENDKNQIKQENCLLQKELDTAKKEKNEVEQEIKKLKDVISLKNDEIKRLKYDNDEKERQIEYNEKCLITKEEEHEKYIKEESLPLYNKGDYDKVDIIENEMNDDQKNYAIEIIRKSLGMYDDHNECAKYVSDQFHNKYGGWWCVFLNIKNYGGFGMRYYANHYIYFTIGEFCVAIFRPSIDDDSIRLVDKGNYNKVDIIKNEMNDDQKNYAIEITRKSLGMYNDHYECAKYVADQFHNKYGGLWNVILDIQYYGNFCITPNANYYICFTMGEFCVAIFRPSIDDDLIRLVDKGNYSKVDIIVNEMNDDQKNFAIEITRKSLGMYDDHYECAKYVSDQFHNKYGGLWHAILNIQDYGSFSIRYYYNYYIYFTIGEFCVAIFRPGIGDESIRLVDKGNYSKVDIIENKMNDDQKNFAIEITRKSLGMYNNNHFECAKYVSDQFHNKYGGIWCVNLHIQDYGDSYTYHDNCYISFTMGEFNVVIAKYSSDEDLIRLVDKGNYNKVEYIKNEMNNDQKNYAIEITRKSLGMYNDHYECAKYVADQFHNKYGGLWNVILDIQYYGSFSIMYNANYYICFTMGEFCVAIFRPSIDDDLIRLVDKGNYSKVDIIENKMNNDQKNYAIEITRKSLGMYNNHYECAKYVSDQFKSKYGGVWCVILNVQGYGDSDFIYYDNYYIHFTMGEFKVSIFKE